MRLKGQTGWWMGSYGSWAASSRGSSGKGRIYCWGGGSRVAKGSVGYGGKGESLKGDIGDGEGLGHD